MNRSEIDALRDAEGALNRAAVSSILPYGDPFLFVDSVSYLTDAQIIAHYEVPLESPLIDAHFRHVAIMPGVLLAEALAQAGIMLLHYNAAFSEPTDIVANAVSQMRFKGPVLPGDLLEEHVSVKAVNALGARLDGRSYVNRSEVLKATFDVTFVARHKLIEHIAQERAAR